MSQQFPNMTPITAGRATQSWRRGPWNSQSTTRSPNASAMNNRPSHGPAFLCMACRLKNVAITASRLRRRGLPGSATLRSCGLTLPGR
jgi:hypothetical protein